MRTGMKRRKISALGPTQTPFSKTINLAAGHPKLKKKKGNRTPPMKEAAV